ncbi:MAG: alpha-L-glutamate ligase-like protein [Thermodesulfobacteriota bacterium]|nr:alpha-L-glutamate ligase-like protein [Thermodesulfobacteriota bacterium]
MGILGINRRNAEYILPVNQREFYPLVDDKLLTKELAVKNGLNVPPLYGVIRYHHQIPSIMDIGERHLHFVVKPSKGSGGQGILVLTRRSPDTFERASGVVLGDNDLKYYISGILAGLYSLGGQEDKALVEYRIEPSPVFAKVTFRGVPDVRLIVYRGVPIMAMLRLPTKESNGKANLHNGAIGVGVDLQTGVTLQGVHHTRLVTTHPDTEENIKGISIPYWKDILNIGARSYDMTGLGYIGVDVAVDQTQGPMILEFNARPGLSIQIANRAGLVPRLNAVDAADLRGMSIEERILMGQRAARHFSPRNS